MVVMWESKDWRCSTEAGLHSNLHFQSKLFMCALLSLQLCLTKFCLFFNGLIIIPMLILVIRETRNKSQKKRHIDIYKRTHTHTHILCIYIYIYMLCAGVTGAVKEAIETLQKSGATAFVLDILNNRSVAVNALKHKKQIKNVHGHAHWFYIVLSLLEFVC